MYDVTVLKKNVVLHQWSLLGVLPPVRAYNYKRQKFLAPPRTSLPLLPPSRRLMASPLATKPKDCGAWPCIMAQEMCVRVFFATPRKLLELEEGPLPAPWASAVMAGALAVRWDSEVGDTLWG